MWSSYVSFPPTRHCRCDYSDSENTDGPCWLKHRGQYHRAGVITAFGLRVWQMAQWKRLSLTAVFGRDCFPVLTLFLLIGQCSFGRRVREAEFFDAEMLPCDHPNDNLGQFDDTHLKNDRDY